MRMKLEMQQHGGRTSSGVPASTGARQPVTSSTVRPFSSGGLETTPLVFIGVGGSLAVERRHSHVTYEVLFWICRSSDVKVLLLVPDSQVQILDSQVLVLVLFHVT